MHDANPQSPYSLRSPVANQSRFLRKEIERIARRGPTQEEAQADKVRRAAEKKAAEAERIRLQKKLAEVLAREGMR